MPRPKKLTQKKNQAIIKAYGKGVSTSELAKKHKVSQRAIQKILKANKDTKKSATQVVKRTKKSVTKRKTKREAKAKEILGSLIQPKSKAGRPPGPSLMVTTEELLRQHNEGISVVDLAKQHGTSPKAIQRQIEKAHKTPQKRKKLDAVLHNVTTVMGNKQMDADMILTGLRKAHQTPKSGDPHSYLVKLLCTNKEAFEPIRKADGGGRGVYKVRGRRKATAPSNGHTPRLRVETVGGKSRKFKAMKQIFVMCQKQGITPPHDVTAFFGGRPPGDGELINLELSPREVEERVVYINLSKLSRKARRLRIEF